MGALGWNLPCRSRESLSVFLRASGLGSCIYIYMCVCVSVYVNIHVNIFEIIGPLKEPYNVYIYIYIYIYTHTHTHTHTHTQT